MKPHYRVLYVTPYHTTTHHTHHTPRTHAPHHHATLHTAALQHCVHEYHTTPHTHEWWAHTPPYTHSPHHTHNTRTTHSHVHTLTHHTTQAMQRIAYTHESEGGCKHIINCLRTHTVPHHTTSHHTIPHHTTHHTTSAHPHMAYFARRTPHAALQRHSTPHHTTHHATKVKLLSRQPHFVHFCGRGKEGEGKRGGKSKEKKGEERCMGRRGSCVYTVFTFLLTRKCFCALPSVRRSSSLCAGVSVRACVRVCECECVHTTTQ